MPHSRSRETINEERFVQERTLSGRRRETFYRDQLTGKVVSAKEAAELSKFSSSSPGDINALIAKAIAEERARIAGGVTPRAEQAQLAIPGILANLQRMRGAQLQGVPTLGNSGGLLGNLANRGAAQIAQGQSQNPTILKAKS